MEPGSNCEQMQSPIAASNESQSSMDLHPSSQEAFDLNMNIKTVAGLLANLGRDSGQESRSDSPGLKPVQSDSINPEDTKANLALEQLESQADLSLEVIFFNFVFIF